MKNPLLWYAQFLVIVLMVSVSFFAFSQTTIYSWYVQAAAPALANAFPHLGYYSTYASLAQLLLALLIFGVSLIIGLFGKKFKEFLVSALAFALFIPVTLSYSRLDLIKLAGAMALEHAPSIYYPVLGEMTLIFCFIALVCLSRTKETSKELTLRGGQASDVGLVVNRQVTVTLAILGCAALVALAASAVLVTGGSAVAALAAKSSGASLILGVLSVVIFAVALYYFFKNSSNK